MRNTRQRNTRQHATAAIAVGSTATMLMALTASCGNSMESSSPTTPERADMTYADAMLKEPIDNHSYERSASPSPTASAPAPAPTSAMANPTVTVTAPGTADPVTGVPAELEIPSFDVVADVVTVGLDSGGGVQVPEDISTVGWYDRSSWIGASQGSIVLVGHRDSAVAGAGALYGIEELTMGDSIVVRSADGDATRFVVREISSVEKTRFSTIVEKVFSVDSPYRLTLITCGGGFDENEGSYLSNIIVTAYPESP